MHILRSLQTLAIAATCAATACAGRAPQPAVPGTPPASATRVDTARGDSLRTRFAVRPVRETAAFSAAVRSGTRTRRGEPGPRYWQNHVAYDITAELDPATARIRGQEIARLHNQSPDTLREVVFHLYQNVFATNVQRTRRVPLTGGMTIERMAVDGISTTPDPAARGAAYRIDGTLMTVRLPYPIPPGGRAEFDIEWSFIVPPTGAPRTGHDEDAFVVAQWYPQIATYDDLRGWHDRPYWSNGEFYLEYGDFDVELTLPEGWLVGATGTLGNPDEVLGPDAAARLQQALSSDEIVAIVTPDDLDASRATARAVGGQLTWHFTAANVRDFAFAASDRYVWDAVAATVAPGRPPTLVSALYRPEAPNWTEAAAYMRHALRTHSAALIPYPWPHITAAEGPIGGMEYPMLVFIGSPEEPADLYAVLSHEIGHQWWPMLAGSNETDHAWQDEGLATYIEDRSVADRFPAVHPFLATQRSYLAIAGSDAEVPIERPADLYGPGPQYSVATYRKPGTMLRALETVLGDSVVLAALRAYVDRWQFRHPSPFDFFNTVEDVAGRDLDWFWSPWWYDTVTLDQAIVAVDIIDLEGGRERATITVEDQGDAPMPVPLSITLGDGSTRGITLPVDPWLEGHTVQQTTIDVTGRIVRIAIDETSSLPDVDRRDNTWSRPSR